MESLKGSIETIRRIVAILCRIVNDPGIRTRQFLPRQRQTATADILTDTDTAHSAKDPLEVKRGQKYPLRNVPYFQIISQIFFDIGQCILNVRP